MRLKIIVIIFILLSLIACIKSKDEHTDNYFSNSSKETIELEREDTSNDICEELMEYHRFSIEYDEKEIERKKIIECGTTCYETYDVDLFYDCVKDMDCLNCIDLCVDLVDKEIIDKDDSINTLTWIIR
jgi:hypothetical protein